MKPGVKALDVGCGVAGPCGGRLLGRDHRGITINEHRSRSATVLRQQGLKATAHLTRGDFQNLPGFRRTKTPLGGHRLPGPGLDGGFDVAKSRPRATSYGPVFSEVARCLKRAASSRPPVGRPERGYDAKNARHVAIKEGHRDRQRPPDAATPADVVAALEAAGFAVPRTATPTPTHAPTDILYDTLDGKMSRRLDDAFPRRAARRHGQLAGARASLPRARRTWLCSTPPSTRGAASICIFRRLGLSRGACPWPPSPLVPPRPPARTAKPPPNWNNPSSVCVRADMRLRTPRSVRAHRLRPRLRPAGCPGPARRSYRRATPFFFGRRREDVEVREFGRCSSGRRPADAQRVVLHLVLALGR